MLKKYGLKLDDTLLAEDHQMGLYDDLIQNRDAKLIPGGAAQNTARGAQYMLPADSVWYVGCVGDDEYAKILRQKCKEQGMRRDSCAAAATASSAEKRTQTLML